MNKPHESVSSIGFKITLGDPSTKELARLRGLLASELERRKRRSVRAGVISTIVIEAILSACEFLAERTVNTWSGGISNGVMYYVHLSFLVAIIGYIHCNYNQHYDEWDTFNFGKGVMYAFIVKAAIDLVTSMVLRFFGGGIKCIILSLVACCLFVQFFAWNRENLKIEYERYAKILVTKS